MSLPADPAMERALLGAVLIHAEEYQADVPIGAFSQPRHRYVWAAITNCVEAGEVPDAAVVTARLRAAGKLGVVGGPEYVSALTDACARVSHARQYADRLLELYSRRQVILAARSAASAAADTSVPLDAVTTELWERCHGAVVTRDRAVPVGEIAKGVLEALERAHQGDAPVGVSTGLRDVDRYSRMHGGDLVVCGGRPGMGKTGLALDVALAVAQSGSTVLIHSLEMSRDSLVRRLLAKLSRVPVEKFRTASFRDTEWGAVAHAFGRLSALPLVIDDTPAVSSAQIRAQAERIARTQDGEQPLGLVVVDYLQLMREPGRWDGRERHQVGQCTRALKGLAKALDIPVLLVSQLSRAVEQRRPPRPQLSDLRESGEIEQDADIVWLLYRPEYYLRDDTPPDEVGIGYVDVAKCRDGRTGAVRLAWRGETTSYVDLHPTGG